MEKPYVVGIDIGGTNTVFGVVDARGTILYTSSIKTGKYTDINDYVAALGDGLKILLTRPAVLRRSKVSVLERQTETSLTVVLNLPPIFPGKVKFLWQK